MWTILLTIVLHQGYKGAVAISTTTIGSYSSAIICQGVAKKIATPDVPIDTGGSGKANVAKTAQCIQVKD